jgi:hypothetical protein
MKDNKWVADPIMVSKADYDQLQAKLDSVSAEWRISFDATIEQSAIISQQADEIERLKKQLIRLEWENKEKDDD